MQGKIVYRVAEYIIERFSCIGLSRLSTTLEDVEYKNICLHPNCKPFHSNFLYMYIHSL